MLALRFGSSYACTVCGLGCAYDQVFGIAMGIVVRVGVKVSVGVSYTVTPG